MIKFNPYVYFQTFNYSSQLPVITFKPMTYLYIAGYEQLRFIFIVKKHDTNPSYAADSYK